MADDAQFLLTDPVETLQRVLQRELGRADRRKVELAEIGNALLQLAKERERPEGGAPVWLPVTAELAPSLLGRLLDTTDGPLRSSVISLQVGPGLEEPIIERARRRIARGMPQRSIYPMSLYDQPEGRQWMQGWAAVGEAQRICLDPPSDFAVFGETAVMAVAEWGNAESNYVLVQDPMLVQAFIHLFDHVFDRALPVPSDSEETDGELRLLRLLSTGYKDEAIARYLGCSLRTVRRRIAMLMALHGAETRFQLGVAAAAQGLVNPPRTPL